MSRYSIHTSLLREFIDFVDVKKGKESNTWRNSRKVFTTNDGKLKKNNGEESKLNALSNSRKVSKTVLTKKKKKKKILFTV